MGAAAILKLQAAGFSAEQVTAIAELIDTQSATKADLDAAEHRLDSKIADFRATAKADLETTEHKLESKVDAVDRRLDIKITAVQGEMTLLKWMMGFVLAFQVAIFAKLLLH
jgi:DNA-binding transcriptional MerR regulator